MAKNYYVKQCVLIKILHEGSVTYTAWIPEKNARIGNTVDIKDMNDIWNKGWKVVSVGTKMPYSEMVERREDYKHQRKASDI